MKESDFKEVNINSIIDLFNRYEIDELNLEDNGVKIELKQDLPLKMRVQRATINTPAAPSIISQPVEPEKTSDKPPIEENKYFEVTSPMSGTFYSAPSPTESSYVKEGSSISEDTTICIIEAMKMMNEIKAEVKGKVVKILVKDGKPVKTGTVLFWVDKN